MYVRVGADAVLLDSAMIFREDKNTWSACDSCLFPVKTPPVVFRQKMQNIT